MRKWFRSLILSLALLSEPLSAADPRPVMDREAIYGDWAQKELTPWFQSQGDQYFASKVPSPKKVVLRYKSFTRDKARGHIVLVHGYGERIEKHMEMAFDFYQAGFNVFAFD